jgi:hypothetical protein
LYFGVGAWMTPVVAFYMRDSLWAAPAAVLLAALVSRLIYRHHLAVGEPVITVESCEGHIAPLWERTRLIPLTFAALLLHLAALSVVASMAHSATILIGGATFVISLFRQTATAPDQTEPQIQSESLVRLSITTGVAMVFVAASLTPYLAVASENATVVDTGRSMEHSTPRSMFTSGKPRANVFQSAASFFRSLLGETPPRGAQGKTGNDASGPRPYPVLQALFGEPQTETGSKASSLGRTSRNKESTVIVAGHSYPGVILRPETKDYVTIVPPPVTRRVFDGRPNERKVDPVSIPFYGAYWFFKASDRTLPTGTIEMRGDPTLSGFKTTDFTPISMEARQNFASLIDLSCCGAIEVVISNGDRRPGTVEVELILANTRSQDKPHQSLGMCPVNSSLRWFSGDDRPPVAETLRFRVPAQPGIRSFDEAIVRFGLKSPRQQWSAKISIEKFRLIPHGL